MNRLTRIALAIHRRRTPPPQHTCETPLDHDLRMDYQSGVLTLYGATPETLKEKLARAVRLTGLRVLAQITPGLTA